MTQPTTITATYQIVTPMFIGDAEQKATGITAASVKGALRFWWRALQWGRVRRECDSEEAALRELHRREGDLFGSAADEEGKKAASKSKIGQAKFMIRVAALKKDKEGKSDWDILSADELDAHKKYSLSPPQDNRGPVRKKSVGQAYLLGQGLCNYERGRGVVYKTDKRDRSALAPEQLFRVELLLKPNAFGYKEQLAEAMLLLGMLGGLGSRARRGIGSIVIRKLEGSNSYAIPATMEDYKALIEKLLADAETMSDISPFSAFSANARIDVSHQGSDAWELLNDVGSEMQLHRSWGMTRRDPHGNVLGDPNQVPYGGSLNQKKVVRGNITSEKNFRPDHDLMLKAVLGACRT